MMYRTILRIALPALLLSASLAATAQTDRAFIASHPRVMAAHYTTYPDTVPLSAPVPEGYEAFYLSHYGRHGSRHHTSASSYNKPLRTLQRAREQGLLTPLGERLYASVAQLADEARGCEGALTHRGAQEHREIAERMFRNYPTIFAPAGGRSVRIESRASQSPRSILSMAANNERLKELNPALKIVRRADVGEMDFLCHTPFIEQHHKEIGRTRSDFLRERGDCSRFAKALFRDGIGELLSEEKMRSFMREIYALYAITECAELPDSTLREAFTDEELFLLWQAQNVRNYHMCANSEAFGDGVVADARPLLRDIVTRADAAVAGGEVAADLRFGHDVALAPLLSLIDLDGRSVRCTDLDRLYESWCDFLVMPMGANLQIVFFRNAAGEVLVELLHNERAGRLPIATDRFPYYRWEDVRAYFTRLAGER